MGCVRHTPHGKDVHMPCCTSEEVPLRRWLPQVNREPDKGISTGVTDPYTAADPVRALAFWITLDLTSYDGAWEVKFILMVYLQPTHAFIMLI